MIDIKGVNPAWRKVAADIRRRLTGTTKAASPLRGRAIANRDSITVQEFISEFRGMTGTARQKLCWPRPDASHVSLHNYFRPAHGQHREHRELAGVAAEARQRCGQSTSALSAESILYRRMEAAGGPKTFTYNRTVSETNGVPA